MKLLFRTEIKENLLTIKKGFTRELFEFLTPPWVTVDLKRFDGCSPGHEVHIQLKQVGMSQTWVSVITQELESEDEWSFVDEGKILPWPLNTWRHHHRVIRKDDATSEIVDDISFECRPSFLNVALYPVLWATFAIRPSRYKKFFEGKK